MKGRSAGQSSRIVGGAAVTLLLVLGACDGGRAPSPPTTPPAPTTPTAPPPALTGLSISGNLTLMAIGETSQLTATASFSDNTTKDVTAGGNWRTGDATVVTVNPGGLLTVVGFGVSDVSFT
ncbi:MAG TPA: hypothetical protein VNJ03_02515, partial [Vicinamibacterales bacterium]|nr:hypothetical protein [Vicinamibacterales bacterium]